MEMIQCSRPSIGSEEIIAVQKVFQTGWLGMGAITKEFEESVSKFLEGTPLSHVIAVNTGTSALHLALDALDLKPGDEVILPALTFVATAQVITSLGCIPVFCDVNEKDLNMDPKQLAKLYSEKTRAIIPVHYRGIPCDMDEILSFAKSRKIRVVEDAAHAFGSYYKGNRIGSFGDLTCFSFDPIKNITCGEGGAITTRSAEIAEKIQIKRVLGIDKDTWSRYRNERAWFYDVVDQGYRYHLSNINAAIGLVQLRKQELINARKIMIAKKYDSAFRAAKNIEILEVDYSGIGLFSYMILVQSGRDNLMAYLKSKGIVSGIHYIPVHCFSYFKKYVRSNLPVTERVYSQLLTMPLYYDMSDQDVEKVIASVLEWVNTR